MKLLWKRTKRKRWKEKKLDEEKIVKKHKNENIQRKQKIKDLNKKKNKRAKRDVIESQPRSINPNIKSIPLNCIHLVNKNDVLYTVTGDGTCGPSSASIFLFYDYSF